MILITTFFSIKESARCYIYVSINSDGIDITAKSRNSQNYEWFNLTGIQRMDMEK